MSFRRILFTVIVHCLSCPAQLVWPQSMKHRAKLKKKRRRLAEPKVGRKERAKEKVSAVVKTKEGAP